MPTTGKKRGILADVRIDNASGTLIDLSTYFTEFNLSNNLKTFDVTAFQSSADEYLPGFTNGRFSGNGFVNGTMIAHMLAVQAALSAGTISTVSVQWGPEGTTTGNPKLTCEALVVDFNPSAKVDDVNRFTLELQVTGAITADVY